MGDGTGTLFFEVGRCDSAATREAKFGAKMGQSDEESRSDVLLGLLARLRERPQDAEYAKISSDVILKSEPPTEHSVEADLEPASLR